LRDSRVLFNRKIVLQLSSRRTILILGVWLLGKKDRFSGKSCFFTSGAFVDF